MEISQQLLKRRIVALLPKRSGEPEVRNDLGADATAGTQNVDVSGLSAITSDENFLRESYRRILGRECDLPGLVNYLELLQRHVPRRTILLQLISSEESKARGVRFTGLPSNLPSARGRKGLLSIREAFGRLGAILRDLIRRILFVRFDSIDHRLNFLLREFASRTDNLAAKTDQSLWSLSEKLDAYVANLSEGQRVYQAQMAQQGTHICDLQRSLDTLRTLLSDVELKSNAFRQELSTQVIRLERQMSQLGTELGALPDNLQSVSVEAQSFRVKFDGEMAQINAALTGEQHRTVTLLAEQAARAARIIELQRALAENLDSIRSLSSSGHDATLAATAQILGRIHPPVISAGPDVLVTEVDNLIIGVPADEWRMAAYHAFRGPMEPGVTKFFSRVVKPGAVIVDIGANVGVYTLLAARLLGGRGKIHSFEPAPRTYRILKNNVQVNGFLEWGMVRLHQLAVTDRTGTARLSIFEGDCGHNTLFRDEHASAEIEVRTTSLDEALAAEERVDLIKMDAEGAEPLILRGMGMILQRNPSIRIILEFAPVHLRRAGIHPMTFLDDIASLGFSVRRIHEENGELLPVTPHELNEAFSLNLFLERPTEVGASP